MKFILHCSILTLAIISSVQGNACSTQSCLTGLYNSHVTYAEMYTRSLASGNCSSSSGKRFITGDGPLRLGCYHAGVVVTVTNGDRWLIHKGSDYGDSSSSSSTVITDAGYMSNAWTRFRSGTVSGHTVNDFMKAAYVNKNYRITGPNCQTAANGMWSLVQ